MKQYPNKQRYYEILRGISPQEKLEKSFELTELANSAFKAGLQNLHPELCDAELEQLYLEKLKSRHSQSY